MSLLGTRHRLYVTRTRVWSPLLSDPADRRYTRPVGGTTQPTVVVSALHVERGGREVLHGIDLTIPTGTVAGFIGPSGCGKSTLMRAIVGVQVVRSGLVSVLGLPAGAAPLRRRVGYSTQFHAVVRVPAGSPVRSLRAP
jgi:ABC-type bacteriocin/lantibiotic exporter with double-glycine peptidase domain